MSRHVGHVVWAIEKSYLYRVFLDANALAPDEVHHSAWCLVGVPHPACLSRLFLGRPGRARLVSRQRVELCFFCKIVRAFVRTYKYIPITVDVYKQPSRVAGMSLSGKSESMVRIPEVALFLAFFRQLHLLSVGTMYSFIRWWLRCRLSNRKFCFVCIQAGLRRCGLTPALAPTMPVCTQDVWYVW